ncbi:MULTISPECIES: sensor histidine kinase [Flavobacteriaceae]|uniref:sensor histidine kinase n=1 Tax=Flavobacteriaceae TaxID=49546 RepID=UPI001491C9FD|nr:MULTISPECIES: HAMP domain-containing sensor histidine kinase [Allomuricauda]MDC6367054.1 HAMP domain-containing sensor histidine kinase [Muricauda sp. AC10]
MKKQIIYITIFVVSILGLAFIQYRYLQIGLSLAKVQFNKKVQGTVTDIKTDLSTENQLTFLVGKALQKDDTYFTLSLDSVQDASSFYLKDFIAEKLVIHGLETKFSYTLHTKDSLYYLKSPINFENEDNLVSYPIELYGYLPDLIDQRLVLDLQFKNLNTYFLGQLNGLTLPSLLFILGIIIAIIWALKTYYWQQNVITTTNEFINNLTHELKTPVFSISLATKLLDEEATPKQKNVVSLIRQQTNRLSAHIDKVLELGNLEHKKNVISLELLDFHPFLKKLCQEFETLSTIQNIDFKYNLEEGPYWLKAEPFHLGNAVNNLLDNANKYSEEPKITLSAFKQNDDLIISVEDNGHGIDPKDHERIFKKYYRVPNKDIHNVKGYGLGLSYAKRVINRFKGKILLESEPRKGTKISIVLRLNKNGIQA